MAYDEALAERIRGILPTTTDITEKKMFGGIAWMYRGNMAVGIVGEDLMVRVGPDAHEKALKLAHARPMDFTGKPMKGYLYVAAQGVRAKKQLTRWLERGLEFAETLPAKKAKKKKAKKKRA